MSVDSFPRQTARTQNFTLGTPRAMSIAPDGSRVAFLRAPGGANRATCLWVLDLDGDPAERLVADPTDLLAGDAEQLTPEERARRERTRTGAAGIVEYATDEDVRIATFALSGRLFVAELDGDGAVRELSAAAPVLDPRPSPVGSHVAYVSNGTLRIIESTGEGDRVLAEPDGPNVTWGLAEFVAQEEMDRTRGYWWSPDGRRLLVARVDTAPVQRWHIGDPANPDRAPAEVAYPAAGTPNALVSLALVDLDGARVEVVWDSAAYPYLVNAHWSAGGPPLLLVMARDQRSAQTLSVDVDNGLSTVVATATDDRWLDVVPGVPQWTRDGRLVTARDDHPSGFPGGERRIYVDGSPVTSSLQVRAVLDVTADDILIAASADEPAETHIYAVPLDDGEDVRRLSTEPGVHTGRRTGRLTVVSSASLAWSGPRVRVYLDGKGEIGQIRSVAETPALVPTVSIRALGERELRATVLYPEGHVPGSAPLPVLMDPYGGPHAQRVVAARNAYLTPQWLANQGFAVVIADGAGTPGRGPDWDREVFLDLAAPVLDDQITALHAAAATHSDLDLSRVAIRGWSFGGYLAALAVLRRPDVFHAAIAGAPVTDWTLYDTFYTERYLGTPADNPDAYERSSILADASKLSRPLLLIHGLADDNVISAHTLRLSSALLAAGRPHTVLPLCGVTHMTPQEVVAENLLIFQVEFLKSAFLT